MARGLAGHEVVTGPNELDRLEPSVACGLAWSLDRGARRAASAASSPSSTGTITAYAPRCGNGPVPSTKGSSRSLTWSSPSAAGSTGSRSSASQMRWCTTGTGHRLGISGDRDGSTAHAARRSHGSPRRRQASPASVRGVEVLGDAGRHLARRVDQARTSPVAVDRQQPPWAGRRIDPPPYAHALSSFSGRDGRQAARRPRRTDVRTRGLRTATAAQRAGRQAELGRRIGPERA